MRLMPLAAIASIALLAACTAPDKTQQAATPAADASPATASTAPEPAGAAQGAPSAKIGADQVGKVSPVPAFKGYGEHWNIDIQSTGEMNHKVDLVWGSGDHKGSGSARYEAAAAGAADAPGAPIVLKGELNTAAGAKPMVVEISAKECIDDGDNKHAHSVEVSVEGMDALLGGCGDLAVY